MFAKLPERNDMTCDFQNNVHTYTSCGVKQESLNNLLILRRGENAFPRLLPSTIV